MYLLYYLPVRTFKQIEEKSLCVCDLYDVLFNWSFIPHRLFIEFAQGKEGILHSNGVTKNQAIVVPSEVLCTSPHFLILLCCSFKEM